jgi:hypothetical protein
MMTARSSCDRSADITSARALAVPATNRREIADLLVPFADLPVCSPTGSRPSP